MIWFRTPVDDKSGRRFVAIYLDRRHLGSYWTMASALQVADRIAAKTGARIWSAKVLPFAKRGAA